MLTIREDVSLDLLQHSLYSSCDEDFFHTVLDARSVHERNGGSDDTSSPDRMAVISMDCNVEITCVCVFASVCQVCECVCVCVFVSRLDDCLYVVYECECDRGLFECLSVNVCSLKFRVFQDMAE